MLLETFKKKIADRTLKVGVIGLGYVGLPLAAAFARKGFPVTGIDIDERKVRQINAGRSYILDVPTKEVAALVKKGRLRATADECALSHADAVIICVPTPLRKRVEPDLEYIVKATRHVAEHLHGGQLIVLESTTHPGTTDEVMLKIFKKTNPKLAVDSDYFLAFSPERVDPGNRRFHTTSIPKVVGGCGPNSTRAAKALYATIVPVIVEVSSAKTAEMVKLLENTFRNVNIAFVNELTKLCHDLGVDVWEVIEAAKTKPFGFMPFYPGPGLGGHCIPIDPHYLNWMFRKGKKGKGEKLIERASEINEEMPAYVVSRLAALLKERGKSLGRAKVLLLGVAYKRDVDDLRESPALEVLECLRAKGAKIAYSDPFVPHFSWKNKTYRSVPLTAAELKRHDCALVLTDHSKFDWALVAKSARLAFDTRNALRSHAGRPNVRFL